MDYITLVKGDDTNFVDDQYIVITFNSELNFTGFSAKFTLGGVTLDYNDISSKWIDIVLPKEFTSNLSNWNVSKVKYMIETFYKCLIQYKKEGNKLVRI